MKRIGKLSITIPEMSGYDFIQTFGAKKKNGIKTLG
jgi:hypothetical protein